MLDLDNISKSSEQLKFKINQVKMEVEELRPTLIKNLDIPFDDRIINKNKNIKEKEGWLWKRKVSSWVKYY